MLDLPLPPAEPPSPEQPGQFPYTRGIHRGMYRDRLWTMRQFAGYGSAKETNARFRYLLAQGQTGLSVAFDLPTLMGLDADDPESLGEVGKCGVAISTVEDMELLFEGIPLGEVSVSMTINASAPVLLAMYMVAAERQGVSWDRLSGTLQNDILKEYIAQKEFLYPPGPSFRLAVDAIEFSTIHMPRYNPVSISGYHIREAGSTAVQELAFTLRAGVEYAGEMVGRGWAVDAFAPRLSFFFNAHNDFFEEIAKFRAARRMWARIMRERFGAQDERSWKLRFHAQTAGCTLTWQQPENNLVRTSLQAMAAVLGGAQSLHTNSLDEAYALPSEYAATLALRTQQVLAFESGVTAAPDPLGGSEHLEALTNRMKQEAWAYLDKIDQLGGMLPAIERGFCQAEIADASYRFQRRVESGEECVVGVNRFAVPGQQPPDLMLVDSAVERAQRQRLNEWRSHRNSALVEASLRDMRLVAATSTNVMGYIIDAVRRGSTTGEICNALGGVFGSWWETAVV